MEVKITMHISQPGPTKVNRDGSVHVDKYKRNNGTNSGMHSRPDASSPKAQAVRFQES